MVAIYADSEMIDLRVRVDDGHFCQWYGVSGVLEGGQLVYRRDLLSPANPTLP